MVRALDPHIGAQLRARRWRGARRDAARVRSSAGPSPGRSSLGGARPVLGCARRRARADRREAAGSPRDERGGLAARPAQVSPARACAFAVVRRVFEQGAYADRAFAAEAAAAGLDAARPGARDADRLRRRAAAAARSTTSPGSWSAGRWTSSSRRSSRRCGSGSISCCTSTASPPTPPSTRASSWSRQRAAAAPGSSTPCFAERSGRVRSLLAALDDREPEGGLARAFGSAMARRDVVGRARRGGGASAAAGGQPRAGVRAAGQHARR